MTSMLSDTASSQHAGTLAVGAQTAVLQELVVRTHCCRPADVRLGQVTHLTDRGAAQEVDGVP